MIHPAPNTRFARGSGWQAPRRFRLRLGAVLFVLALGVSTMGCDTIVGVGVGVSYPGPMYGPYPLITMPGGPIVY